MNIALQRRQILDLILPYGYRAISFFYVSIHGRRELLVSTHSNLALVTATDSLQVKVPFNDSTYGLLYLVPNTDALSWKEVLQHRPAFTLLLQQVMTTHSLNIQLKASEALYAGFSHEIKTPLAAALPLIELMQRQMPKVSSCDKCTRLLTRIQQHIKSVLGIVMKFLDQQAYSRTQMHLVLHECDLSALVVSSVRYFREAYPRSQDHEWKVQVPNKLMAQIDILHFEGVIANLLSNAVKYAPHSPIKVTLSLNNSLIRLEVADLGPGILPEHRPQLFEAFQRGAYAESKIAGHGLGLYWVRRILQAHGGDIELDTSTESVGCRWICELPLMTP